jgi:hypothetical protein
LFFTDRQVEIGSSCARLDVSVAQKVVLEALSVVVFLVRLEPIDLIHFARIPSFKMSLLTTNTIRFLILLASLVHSIPFSKNVRSTYRPVSPDKKNPATSSPLFSRRQRGGAFVDAHLTRRLLTCISAHVNEVAVAPCPPVESAHLKLGSSAMLKRVEEEETTSPNGEEEPPRVNTAVLHTYHDPIQNVTLCGVNVSKRKFQAWLAHTLEPGNYNASLLSTKHGQLDDISVRKELRTLWRQERLLTDRTEVLAIYPSEVNNAKKKRGGFPDLLHIYAERLFYIIQDELEEEQMTRQVPQDIQDILEGGLYGWLEREYKGGDKLRHETMQHLTVEEQHAVRDECIVFENVRIQHVSHRRFRVSDFSTLFRVVSFTISLLL